MLQATKPLAQKCIFEDFTPGDIADRYDLLAIELWEAGQLEKALAALAQSEKICLEHGLKFDRADIRQDIENEINSDQ